MKFKFLAVATLLFVLEGKPVMAADFRDNMHPGGHFLRNNVPSRSLQPVIPIASYDFDIDAQGWTTGVNDYTACGDQVTASTHWELSSNLGPQPLPSQFWTNINSGRLGPESAYATSPPITTVCTNPTITFDSYSSNESGYPKYYDVEHVQLSIVSFLPRFHFFLLLL